MVAGSAGDVHREIYSLLKGTLRSVSSASRREESKNKRGFPQLSVNIKVVRAVVQPRREAATQERRKIKTVGGRDGCTYSESG